MAAELASIQPFESISEWEWKLFSEWLSKSQGEEGLTPAFEYGTNPSQFLVFNILEAARSRVENGLPPNGELWARPTPEETLRATEEVKKRLTSCND